MRYLALILLLPTFGVLTWLYCAYPRALPRTPARVRYDVAVIVLGLASTLFALLGAYDYPWATGDAIWRQIMASVAAYHVYPVVLAIGSWLRARVLA